MIKENVKKLLAELPQGVEIVAACKTRSDVEILEAVQAGIHIVGENYIQEAEEVLASIGKRAKWHFIGHLQKNKVKKAVKLFDMIETVDSLELALEIDKVCSRQQKTVEVLIEVNSGKEEQKFGVFSEKVEDLIRKLTPLKHIKVMGLMTMGPFSGDPEDARPYFIETRKLFENIKSLGIQGITMRYLSMGMSNSYKVAIEEGANMVRIGTAIFGDRREK